MSEAKVRGIIHLVDETKTYGQKGFRKRQVVLEQDNGRFTNYIPLEFTGDDCDRADELNVGDELAFHGLHEHLIDEISVRLRELHRERSEVLPQR